MPACCSAVKHPWDEHEVERRWLPRALRCLIIGENPGDTTSEYFYQPPASYASDAVVVRRALLRGLHHHGLIPEPTLEGFRDAGFLFTMRSGANCLGTTWPPSSTARCATPRAESRIRLISGAGSPSRWSCGSWAIWRAMRLRTSRRNSRRRDGASRCRRTPGRSRLALASSYPSTLRGGTKRRLHAFAKRSCALLPARVYFTMSNSASERTVGSHALAAAAHRER